MLWICFCVRACVYDFDIMATQRMHPITPTSSFVTSRPPPSSWLFIAIYKHFGYFVVFNTEYIMTMTVGGMGATPIKYGTILLYRAERQGAARRKRKALKF